MALIVLKGFGWGVDKLTLSEGAGAIAAPQVASAASIAVDRVRVTFNQSMDVDSIGRFQDYRIVHVSSGNVLGVVGLLPVSDTEVNLITDAQENTTYEVTVTRVQDEWGTSINNLANNTAQFAGTSMTSYYPSATDQETFYGLQSGMQSENHPDFNPDLGAPIIQNQNPAPTAFGVLRGSNVYLEIIDLLNGVDEASVVLKVDGVTAWTGDTQQAGYVVTKGVVANGFSYDINPDVDFTSYQSIVVGVYAADLAPLPNVLDTTYAFTVEDFEAPYLTSQAPYPGETGVSPIVHTIFRIIDDGAGVDPAAVTIVIDGNTAWAAGALQGGFVGTQTLVSGGYEYDLQPTTPLTPLSTVIVDVVADDLDANTLNTSYSFDVGLDVAPEFENLDPAEDETNVAPDKALSFDIVDNVAVDVTKTLIFISGVLAYENEVSKNGFVVVRSPVLYGYNYLITGPGWDYGGAVFVEASARDTLNTPAAKAWLFHIEVDPTCFSGPSNAVEDDLLTPFAVLDFNERLRKTLLAAATHQDNDTAAARVIFLNAFSQELAPVLDQMVAAPTDAEKAARLCYRATNLEVSDALRRKTNMLPGAIRELRTLGLPREHADMLDAYAAEDQPNTEVPLACLIVLLAKALV